MHLDAGMSSLVSRVHWGRHRNGYQRLGSPSRRPLRVVRLGGRRTTPQQATTSAPGNVPWKARAARLRAALLLSPARLLVVLRDAYVDAMLALAGGAGRPCAALARSRSGAGGAGAEGGLWAKRVPRSRLQMAGGGDFERRMMAHIYGMLVTPELPGAAACRAA